MDRVKVASELVRLARKVVGRGVEAIDLSPPDDVGTARGSKAWMQSIRMAILAENPGMDRDAVIAIAKKQLGYAMFLFRGKSAAKSFMKFRAELDDLRESGIY